MELRCKEEHEEIHQSKHLNPTLTYKEQVLYTAEQICLTPWQEASEKKENQCFKDYE